MHIEFWKIDMDISLKYVLIQLYNCMDHTVIVAISWISFLNEMFQVLGFSFIESAQIPDNLIEDDGKHLPHEI